MHARLYLKLVLKAKANFTRRLQTLKDKIRVLGARVGELERSVAQLRADKRRLWDDIDDLEDENRALGREKMELVDDKHELKEDYEWLSDQHYALTERLGEAEAKINELREKVVYEGGMREDLEKQMEVVREAAAPRREVKIKEEEQEE